MEQCSQAQHRMEFQTDMSYASQSPTEKGAATPLLPSPNYIGAYRVDPELVRSPQPRRSGSRRFLRAFLFISLSLFIVVTLAKHAPHVAHMCHSIRDHLMRPDIPSADVPEHCVRDANWSIDTDVHHHPEHPEHLPRAATTSFALPISSDLLYLVAHGSPLFASGSVEIIDDGDVGSDAAIIEIVAFFEHEHAFSLTRVCALQPAEGTNGVGIFAPPSTHRRHQQVRFEIKVRLPSAPVGSTLSIARFETHLPWFAHHVGADSVHFAALSLRSALMPIGVSTVSGDHIEMTTSLAPIQGSFNTSRYLGLRTSNARIAVAVGMSNDPAGDATVLEVQTSNSPIDAVVDLLSTSGTGGHFSVEARTSNGPITFANPSSPVDSVLRAGVRTANSPVRAVLPTTFEGAFSLSSSFPFTPTVEGDTSVEDPAGRGRTRSIAVSRVVRGAVEGEARWLPAAERELGFVKLSTANSPVHLIF